MQEKLQLLVHCKVELDHFYRFPGTWSYRFLHQTHTAAQQASEEILLHQFEEKQPSKWIKQIKTYNAIEHYNPAKIKKLVKSWDNCFWMKDIQYKSTMYISSPLNENLVSAF